MAVIYLQTAIDAPIGRCFDLACSIDLHTQSMAQQRERAVVGRTKGLIKLGEEVTWEARHIGIKQRLTSRITAFERPRYFQDTRVQGAFKQCVHDHKFEKQGSATLMQDVFDYSAPLGLLGHLAERLFLMCYMANLLRQRNPVIKAIDEDDQWQDVLVG